MLCSLLACRGGSGASSGISCGDSLGLLCSFPGPHALHGPLTRVGCRCRTLLEVPSRSGFALATLS